MDSTRMLLTPKVLLSLLLAGSVSGAFAESAVNGPAMGEDIELAVNQEGTVSGVVTDEQGPVIGASVVIKGTTNGTVTDFDGKFSIPGAKKGDVISISYVGYVTQEIVWDGSQALQIHLKADSQNLDEFLTSSMRHPEIILK